MKSKVLVVLSLVAIIPLAYLVHHSQATVATETMHTDKSLPPSPGPIMQMPPMTKEVPAAAPSKVKKITKIKSAKPVVAKQEPVAQEPLAGMRQQQREQAQRNANPYSAQQLAVVEPQARGQVYDPMAKRWVPALSGPNVKLNMGKAARKETTCQDDSCVVKGENGVSVAGVVVNTHKQRASDDPGLMEGQVAQGNGVVTPVVYVK